MDKQRIFNKEELEFVYNITTKKIGNGKSQFRRWVGSTSELGNRTMNCIGYNMLFNPELFNPVFSSFRDGEPISIEGNICICGCSLCNKLFLTNHIESGHQFWVGSSCIEKSRKNMEKKLNELIIKMENKGLTDKEKSTMIKLYEKLNKSKIEYDKFHRWELDKEKIRCADCKIVLYTKKGKDIVKNIENEDYTNPQKDKRCFKCDEKYKANNCLCCDNKLLLNCKYNEDNTKEHLYKLDYCYDCGTNYKLHTFTSNIDFYNPMYKEVVNKNKIIPLDGDKWGVRGRLLKLPSNIRQNILGSKNYNSQEEDSDYENCEFYKYDINDDLDQE